MFKFDRNTARAKITVGELFRDHQWSEGGGLVSQLLQDLVAETVELDFSETIWADPLPLMSLICLIKGFTTSDKSLIKTFVFDLGSPLRNGRRFFLGFIAVHGFIKAIASCSTIRYDDATYDQDNVATLESRLTRLNQALAYRNAECIILTVFETKALRAITSRTRFVEQLVDQAHDNGINRWLWSSSRQRGLLLHTIRIILTETIENIVEHAYRNDGFGAVFARIRPGFPEEPNQLRVWKTFLDRERQYCPTVSRCNWKRPPGWIELFICDAGLGLANSLSAHSRSPSLLAIANRLFREPLSRYSNEQRRSKGKTSLTGFQHLGHILNKGDELGEFVRIYTNGEWFGEHMPWPKDDVRSARSAYNYPFVHGTMIHFALAPPPATLEEQWKLYPAGFQGRRADDLIEIRRALETTAAPTSIPSYDIKDFYVDKFLSSVSLRGVGAEKWISRLTSGLVLIRPARTLRKADLVDQVRKLIAAQLNVARIIMFVDVPASLAIDMSGILSQEHFGDVVTERGINIVIISQDWFCAYYVFDMTERRLISNQQLALSFLLARIHQPGGAFIASALRELDSTAFWESVGEAFIPERVIWTSTRAKTDIITYDVEGYLDLTLALFNEECAQAAKRSVRRAMSALRITHGIASDDLVVNIIDTQFTTLDGHRSLSVHSIVQDVIVVGSICVSGGTTDRFRNRRDINVVGIVQLLQHEQARPGEPSRNKLIALRWITPTAIEPSKGKSYERIPNTPFVVRGGEKAIPLPRFTRSPDGQSLVSLYGETPDEMYARWQRSGSLKIGHWNYGQHHDLLTVNLAEEIEYDLADGGKIVSWLNTQLSHWYNMAISRHAALIVLYPSHPVADRIVSLLRGANKFGIDYFPVKSLRRTWVSPLLISAVEREMLGRLLRRKRTDMDVILLDDGVVTGQTFKQFGLFVEGLWEALKKSNRIGLAASLSIRTIALLDRTGLPTQRDLVERDRANHPRFWRWDVPSMGHEGACVLCMALDHCRDIASQIPSRDSEGGERHW